MLRDPLNAISSIFIPLVSSNATNGMISDCDERADTFKRDLLNAINLFA